MTSVQNESSLLSLPPGHSLAYAVHDSTGNLLLAASTDSSGQYSIQVCEAAPNQQQWETVASWQIDSPVTSVDWAAPEYGRLAAVGTRSGQIAICELRPKYDKGVQLTAEFQLTSSISCSSSGVRQVQFAPRQTGLVLGALGEDGFMHVYEADRVLASSCWSLQSKFQVGDPKSCSAFSWRPQAGSAFLCVAAGSAATIWYFLASFNTWQRAVVMEASGPTSSVDWAQPLARPQELVAVGAGATVHVFGLKGDACRGTMQYELLADLSHAAPVWRVQWDQMGNQLAVSTDDQCVHVYRPDMVGNWRKLVCLAGSAEVEGGPTDLECD